MSQIDETKKRDDDERPEDHPGETGAEGGSSSAQGVKTPADPHPDDDSPLGDTDQHSDA